MKRRNLLIGFGAAATGTSVALGSGAFSTVEANRRAQISITGDSNAYLALEAGSENGAFVDTDGRQVVLDFGDNGEGAGVGLDSTYTFDGTLLLRNQGTGPARSRRSRSSSPRGSRRTPPTRTATATRPPTPRRTCCR